MSKKPSKKASPTEEPGTDARPDFDASIAEIESLIDQIESGSIGLEEQLAAYERGARLLRGCRSMLDAAEKRVEEIDADLNRLEGSAPGTDDDGSAD